MISIAFKKPQAFTFLLQMSTVSGSISIPKRAPGGISIRFSSIFAFTFSQSLEEYWGREKKPQFFRRYPGAVLEAIRAASISKVPEPQHGSKKI